MSTKTHHNALLFLKKAQGGEEKDFKESFEKTNPLQVSGFKGIFGEPALEHKEQTELQMLLFEYYKPGLVKEEQVSRDLQDLILLTAELRAISRQSLILQGERIKKAQLLLRNYRDGAFTAWLLATYGNRQTPYSLLQYYELHQALPLPLRVEMEKMPRKAAYALASRQGPLARKMQIIELHASATQQDLLALIVEAFPSTSLDKRRKTINQATLDAMAKLCARLQKRHSALTDEDRLRLHELAGVMQKMAL